MTAEPISQLSQRIAACRICRDQPSYGMDKALPHEPRPVCILSANAKILIAGQAPGLRVHETGLPFNDASGDRLRDWLGIGRDLFYDPDRFAIVPMGFCFPGYDAKGHDLPPRRECAPVWRAEAMAAMPQLKLLLTIGHYAMKWHMGAICRKTMTDTVAAWRDGFMVNSEPRILPLPHPSWRNSGWLKRNPWFEAEVLPVLRQAVRDLAI
ncbi:uracil-DNA glycosylase family protein [Martelella sp. HB161492]|uniref:uracil-DNA glycosylase family protein n=1 Tax=Martelella sp. HB161492 TaxID=2720726 RepID=UPI0015909B18|nr:uracil-DNA glycosylase family protein [Martelella sp. HB161492]